MEAAPLVDMKLKSPRRMDHVDVIEMITGGIDDQHKTVGSRSWLARTPSPSRAHSVYAR